MLPDAIKDEPLALALTQFDSAAITGGHKQLGELTVEVAPSSIVSVLTYLHDKEQFNRLGTIFAVDRYPAEPRFEVIYQVQSMDRNLRLRIKARLPGVNPEIDSITGIYKGANWYERETFDLFGINFRNHPNLIRLLMPEGYVGHPLRRDFPIHGHKYSYKDE